MYVLSEGHDVSHCTNRAGCQQLRSTHSNAQSTGASGPGCSIGAKLWETTTFPVTVPLQNNLIRSQDVRAIITTLIVKNEPSS